MTRSKNDNLRLILIPSILAIALPNFVLWVEQMLAGACLSDPPTVPKYFFPSFGEAQSWLVENFGPEDQGWHRCARCRPGGLPAGARIHERAVRDVAAAPTARTVVSAAPQGGAAMPGSWPMDAAFAKPSSPPRELPVPPQFASWDHNDHPRQKRLRQYLEVADERLRPHYQRLTGPLALRLDVGLPRDHDLLDQRDLDNFLYPLAQQISGNIRGRLVCVWGTKQHANRSFVRIEEAVPALTGTEFDYCHTVRTTASLQSPAFKKQIRDQVSATQPLPDGPVWMLLSFTVGKRWNWLSAWKPCIDALGQILGHSSPAKTWSPLDGRIVDLGLHCRVDAAVGNDVLITIAAGNVRPQQ